MGDGTCFKSIKIWIAVGNVQNRSVKSIVGRMRVKSIESNAEWRE